MLTPLKAIAARVGAFFRGPELDRDFELELESHIALLADDNVRRGMTVETARREARLALGALEATKELHREARGLPALAALLQDLRYAARTLRRDAGLAVFAILTLGLGIGASATVFSTIDALLLRPLPFRDPGRLIWVANSGGEGSPVTTIQVGHFVDLRQQSRSFADLAAFNAFHGVGKQKLTGDGLPERLSGVQVTQNFFSLLGIEPQLGRTFTAEECEARWRAPQAVLLSDGLWRRRFAADPGIVGRQITLNEAAVTVVGVLPASFDLAAALEPGNPLDLYLPLPLTEETNRKGNLLAVVGRLKPGATVEGAQAELGILGRRLTQEHPERNGVAPRLAPLAEHVSGRLRPALSVLAVAVGVVMLIVCANLSNLLLARMAARQREMAVRAALGAGRGRLIRQLLTESLVLSGYGALLGVILAVAGTAALAHLEAFNLPLLTSVRVDLPALGFILLLAVLSGLLFGVLPALQAPAVPLHDALKDGGRGSSGSAAQARLRGALVVSEIALACVLLVASGLLLHSLVRLLDVDLGYRPERTAVLRVDPGVRYSTRPLRNAYYDEVIRRVKSLPGIEAAGLTDVLPLGGDRTWGVAGSGEVYVQDKGRDTFVRVVSDGYLRAAGIPLRAGRDFTARDTPAGEPVALINETLARTLWPGEEAIGRMVTLFEGRRRVVGVVGDVRHSALEQEAGNEIYLPIRQTDDYSAVHLVVRTALSPGALASSVRRELQPIEPSLTSGDLRALERLVSQALSPRRFVALLLAGFSAFALALAALGVYAVISYGVGQRTRELGIRAALGASGHDLKARILAETLGLAGLGMLLGALASWILARALKGLLFEITATDPATFGGMLVLLAAAATLAGYLPARRAARIDPNSALRGG